MRQTRHCGYNMRFVLFSSSKNYTVLNTRISRNAYLFFALHRCSCKVFQRWRSNAFSSVKIKPSINKYWSKCFKNKIFGTVEINDLHRNDFTWNAAILLYLIVFYDQGLQQMKLVNVILKQKTIQNKKKIPQNKT